MKAEEIVESEVKRQAEFGYEPSFEDMVIAGIQQGRKEVVDFIGGYDKPFPNQRDWKTKLKEWKL